MNTRNTRRFFASVALAAALAAMPTAGAAALGIEWPFLAHANDVWFWPSQPEDQSPVTLNLGSEYPFPCGTITAEVVDSAHVSLTITATPSCPDTVPIRRWVHSFELGRLAAGMHDVAVHVQVHWPDGSITHENGVIPFEVVHLVPPPPGENFGSTFLWASTSPDAPTIHDDVTLNLTGRFPYHCGRIVDAQVVTPHEVRFTLRPDSSCADTVQAWTQSFVLGRLPRGDNLVWVRVAIEGYPVRTSDSLAVGVHVTDPDEPPPPPDTPRFTVTVQPEHPAAGDAVTLTARGTFATGCGGILDSRVVDAHHVELTLRDDATCGTPPEPWEQSFALGVLPSGEHRIRVLATFEGDSLDPVDSTWVNVFVAGEDDSLSALMSPGRPNPFRDESRFSVSLDRAAPAEISVFDLNGRRVATVYRGLMPAGTSEMRWNGRRGDGSWAPSGIYFYRLSLPDRVVSRRVVLLARP